MSSRLLPWRVYARLVAFMPRHFLLEVAVAGASCHKPSAAVVTVTIATVGCYIADPMFWAMMRYYYHILEKIKYSHLAKTMLELKSITLV